MSRAQLIALLLLFAGLIGATVSGVSAEDELTPRPDRLTVEGSDGIGIQGALLVETAQSLDGHPVFDPGLPVRATTGPDGVVETLGDPSVRRLVVWAEGRAATLVPATAFATTLQLPRGHVIDGVVRYSGGSAAAGVTVLAIPIERDGLVFRSRTDSTGRYQLVALPAGRWTLYLRRSGERLQSLGEVASGDEAPDVVLVGNASVRGKLLDGDGESKDIAAGVPLRFVSMPGTAGTTVIREVTSGDDGWFLVGDLTPGIYKVHVAGHTWELDQSIPRVRVRRGKTQTLRPWFVRHRVDVVGSVVDADRKPLASATIRLLREVPDDPDAERAALDLRPERSSRDGAFRLRQVSPGEGYRLVITAPGFSPWISHRFRVDRKTVTRLKPARLVPGWRLEVRVRNPKGGPVEGVSVEATPTTHPARAEDPVRSAFVRRATTDAEGKVVLADLLDTDVRVVVRGRTWLEHDEVVPVPLAGRHRRVDVPLVPSVRLTGRVVGVDGPLSAPVRVRVVPSDGQGVREVRTDTSGRFEFDSLRSVATDLEVRRADADDVVLARQVGLMITDALDLEVVLPTLYRIAGFVTGLEPGGPPPIVVLEAPIRDPERERFRWETVASITVERDRGGDAPFVFEDLPPGPYALRAVQGGRDSSAKSIRIDDTLLEDVELPIPVGARVAGTVLDRAGEPLLGAAITLERLRGDGDAPKRPGAPIQTATDLDGGYVMSDLAPGEWRIRAAFEGAREATLDVRVGEGDVLVVEDLTLGTGASVEGTVLDMAGDPMDGATLRLRDRSRRFTDRFARTDQDGRFRFPFVASSLYLLTLETASQGAVRPEVEVEVADTETVEVDFDVAGGGRIEGTVTLRGRRVPSALLELVSEPLDPSVAVRRYRARADTTGAFAFEHLPAGGYRLELRYGSARSTRPVWLDEGDRVTLDVHAAEARLLGRVETRGGRRVSGADVIARALDEDGRPAGSGLEARGRTSPQGEFVLSGLPVGWYAIEVKAPGLPPGALAAAEAEVEGADRPVTIVLGRGGDLVVDVLDTAGRPVTGARVWVEDDTGLPFHSRPYVTGPGGQVVIEGIPSGDVRVRVQARGFGRPPTHRVAISDGGVAGLDVTLRAPGVLLLIVSGRGRDPVTRARIDVLREGTDDVVERRRPLGRVHGDPRWGHVPKTGVLRIDELETGPYEIVIDAGDTYPITRLGVDVAAGEVTVARVELVPR